MTTNLRFVLTTALHSRCPEPHYRLHSLHSARGKRVSESVGGKKGWKKRRNGRKRIKTVSRAMPTKARQRVARRVGAAEKRARHTRAVRAKRGVLLTSSWLSSLMAIPLSRPFRLTLSSASARGLALVAAVVRARKGDAPRVDNCGRDVSEIWTVTPHLFAFGRECSGLAPSHGRSLLPVQAASSILQNS